MTTCLTMFDDVICRFSLTEQYSALYLTLFLKGNKQLKFSIVNLAIHQKISVPHWLRAYLHLPYQIIDLIYKHRSVSTEVFVAFMY